EPAAFIDRAIGGDTSGIDQLLEDLERNERPDGPVDN
ncbi:MAG: hydrolase, partial [Mycobacterium sp.]|nr:hydrolase [Mycobacterium sp.]